VVLIVVGTFGFIQLEGGHRPEFYTYSENSRVLGVPFVNAFYWCCVTITTVGYGDVTPTTVGGKWFAIGYIFIGILS